MCNIYELREIKFFMTTGQPCRGHPKSKVITGSEPMLFEQTGPKCNRADQSTPGTEPNNNGVPLTLCKPVKYWDIKHDTFGHLAVLYSENTKSKRKIVLSGIFLPLIPATWRK